MIYISSQHLWHLQEGLVDSKPREFRHLLALDASMSELVNVLQPPGKVWTSKLPLFPI